MKTLLVKWKETGKERIKEAFYTELYSYIKKIVGLFSSDTHLIDDVVQEVAIYMWKYFDKIDLQHLNNIQDFDNYIYITLKRRIFKIIMSIKKNMSVKLFSELSDDNFEFVDMQESTNLDIDEMIYYRDKLNSLPDKQRTIILMLMGGYSQQEIADTLNITQGNVSKILKSLSKGV